MSFFENENSNIDKFWNSSEDFEDEKQRNFIFSNDFNQNPFEYKKFHVLPKENTTSTTCATINPIFPRKSEYVEDIQSNGTKKKYFKIKKFLRYDQIIREICSDNEDEKVTAKKGKVNPKRRIKLISGIPKNKPLTNVERVQKMKILSKIVRRYRRKLKNLKKKFKVNIEKSFKTHINKNRIGNKKDKRTEINISLPNLIKAMNNLKNSQSIEFSHEKNLIENFIHMVAEKKLRPDSLQMKKICSQVRLFLNNPVNHISRTKPKAYIKMNDRQVPITQDEYNLYKKLGNNVEAFKVIFGLKENVKNQVIYETKENTVDNKTYGYSGSGNNEDNDADAFFDQFLQQNNFDEQKIF